MQVMAPGRTYNVCIRMMYTFSVSRLFGCIMIPRAMFRRDSQSGEDGQIKHTLLRHKEKKRKGHGIIVDV